MTVIYQHGSSENTGLLHGLNKHQFFASIYAIPNIPRGVLCLRGMFSLCVGVGKLNGSLLSSYRKPAHTHLRDWVDDSRTARMS